MTQAARAPAPSLFVGGHCFDAAREHVAEVDHGVQHDFFGDAVCIDTDLRARAGDARLVDEVRREGEKLVMRQVGVFEKVPAGALITDARNPLARLQLPIAEKHFVAMNELLPLDVWLN